MQRTSVTLLEEDFETKCVLAMPHKRPARSPTRKIHERGFCLSKPSKLFFIMSTTLVGDVAEDTEEGTDCIEKLVVYWVYDERTKHTSDVVISTPMEQEKECSFHTHHHHCLSSRRHTLIAHARSEHSRNERTIYTVLFRELFWRDRTIYLSFVYSISLTS